jgi:transcriptional regulator with XRE-family HTH domain
MGRLPNDALTKGSISTVPFRAPSSTDQLIGIRIRERRMVLGLTQLQLSELVGVTYQQFHRYELGINSISAGRLYEIARVSGTPVEYYFEGLETGNMELPPRLRRQLDISRDFGEIENEKHRQAISQLTRALAGDCAK